MIKQPDGHYCLWNSENDKVFQKNMSELDVLFYFKNSYAQRGLREGERILEDIKSGRPAYRQFTKAWEEVNGTD